MIPFVEPLAVGDHVEAKFCAGRYGETRTVRGIITELNALGGMYLTLDPDTAPFSESGRDEASYCHPGHRYYICNAFDYDYGKKVRVGKGVFSDCEHGHTYYCRKL